MKLKLKLKKRNTFDLKEVSIVKKILNSGNLSGYVGEWDSQFYGGKYVKKFENKICKYFNVRYAVAVNSWTSGLICAIGALDISPGDEILVPPWTMSASATAIIHWNAIPVFVDIDPENFCIDPKKIEEKITNKTKAIMVVDIFGQSADMDEINKIAKKYKLKVISDSAQSIGAKYKNKFAGTLGDIGGFSFNFHKHIHCGEGGVLVTNNKLLSEKMRMIANHAEAVMRKRKNFPITNMIGYNFRLTEIQAAILIEQLKKLKGILKKQNLLAKKLNDGLKNLEGLKIPKIDKKKTHSYYVYPILYLQKKNKINRASIVNQLKLKGLKGIGEGYTNLHLLPIFKRKIAYGSKRSIPWILNKKKYYYKKGICPIAEKYHEKMFIPFGLMLYDFSLKDIRFYIDVIKNVWEKNF
jgi:perosamine synthetase